MLKKFKLIFLILLIAFNLQSCRKYFITFETFEVNTNLPLTGNWFWEENIIVNFSMEILTPDNNNFTLLLNDKQIDCDFDFKNNFLAKPSNGWQLGKEYCFKINGDFYTTSGNSFYVKNDFYFTYGKEPNYLELIDFAFDIKKVELTFNKEIAKENIQNKISISPSTKTNFTFNENNTKIIITPETFFAPSTSFELTINDLTATDKWPLKNSITKNFRTSDVLELPEVLEINKCQLENNQVTTLSKIENSIEDFSTIEIIFNKQIDYFSLLENINISPAIDFFIQVPENKENCFVIIFREEFTKDKKYKLTISKELTDYQNVNLLEDYCFEFYPSKDYLEITEIKINEDEIFNIESEQQNKYSKVTSSSDTTTIMISFNKKVQIQNITDYIQLESFFPSTANIPVLSRAFFSTLQDKIYLEYQNLSISTETKEFYYKLTIKNTLGIGENKCVYFIIK